MPFFRFGAFVACLSLAAPVAAEPGLVVTLESVGDRVRAQNPNLAAARLRIREAQGRMNQSGRLSNPELETGFEHNTRFEEGLFEIGLNQRFPLTDRLALEKKVTATEVKAAEAEVREVERRLIAEAREGVVMILSNHQRRILLGKQSELSGEFAKLLSEIAARGEGSLLDAGQAKLEAASLKVQMRQLDAEETALLGRIKPLLGMYPAEALLVSGALPEVVVPVAGVSHGERPDFKVASLEAEAAAQGVELEYARRQEDVEAGLFAGVERREDAPEGFETEGIVGLRFKIPLPFWNKNEGKIEEAVARAERKDREAKALARTIDLEVDGARREMAEWKALLAELGRELIPLAEEQVAGAEEAIKQGQGDIQTVFRNREKLLQLSAARLDALREFHLARVRYEAAKGSF
ncbi:TolC family protein [Haloferula sp.]|uniref:TolC family protein n=1 Tax=Haloferula sp. TaxID=2497595 RepID=UPI003C727375